MTSASTPPTVTPESFIRAETDRYFADISARAGGVNRLFHYRRVASLDQQNVVRINRDTLYSMGVVDTEAGATITMPAMPDGRYASIYLVDNDHYCPGVIYDAGTHSLPTDTKYLGVGVRIQLFDPADADEVGLVNGLQEQFVLSAASGDEFVEPAWDRAQLDALRASYLREFATIGQYPADWQGPRGAVNEATRHLAAAGAWGLFPERDAIYINYDPHLDAAHCFVATYDVPENHAFWSITVYGPDGYLKSDNSIRNAANTAMNADGTFTVAFGTTDACADSPNRLDIVDGWNFLMRVYRPGESVLDRTYTLPVVT